ncbi:DnaA protein helix-turn-helix [Bosea sp. 62]|nr:DnaA protein helix-turn-helix [Bosea sp. 7B]CAD5298790.1 DnaA protein helix-turn-helix [Bosea sp. 21B]CAD5298939.1 DnaA protein helix-turn-helix [Bosea sp. 46]VVT61539.1 DnaA protein helix-turn-helix [Bosea sp. EC-HK365B]VXB10970.1 DnaA protein helix-turn-helix [Bosea sp. 127]VXB32369.1 DnaA protein helix-turn-helix [Bosea sp. 125]VXC81027.1 DnaA protein helix-turn-helix [Bosea sp. 62]VXC85659.1 DnaA protein helix-turn-helix [Bosea sp. 29B]
MEHIMNILIAKRPDVIRWSAPARLVEAAVCGAMGLPAGALRTGRGQRRIAFARQLAMYLTHVGFGLTLTQVGACFERDRTTVRHACALVEDRRDQPAFDLAVSALETGLAHLAFGLQLGFASEAA